MHTFQIWLVSAFGGAPAVADLMNTAWAWPMAESLHFIGLCMLVGAIGAFDLRLLGVARRVPIAAVHRLVPWGIAGFVLNVSTGLLFLLSAPDQYIYNPAFHLKLMFIAIAGIKIIYSIVNIITRPPTACIPIDRRWVRVTYEVETLRIGHVMVVNSTG